MLRCNDALFRGLVEKLVTKLLEFGMPNEDDNSTKLREKLNAKGSVRVQEFVTESRLAVPFSVKSLSSVLLDYPTNPE